MRLTCLAAGTSPFRIPDRHKWRLRGGTSTCASSAGYAHGVHIRARCPKAPELHAERSMPLLMADDAPAPSSERPTIPAPRLHSEVRLIVARKPCAGATVDVVVCDL